MSNPEGRDIISHVSGTWTGLKPDQSTHCRPNDIRCWRLVDRLGEQIISQILDDSRAGLSKRKLAQQYGISLSSVKRLGKLG